MIRLKAELNIALDRLAIFIAWQLPNRLVYWCALRVVSHGTTGEYSNQMVPELTAVDALARWDNRGF